ncbi:MAG: phage minor head protein, partial [Planctomycetota bacterium]
ARHGKQAGGELTPEELQILEFEVPDDVRDRVRATVEESLAQDYWEGTNDHTLSVIETAVKTGVNEGLSPQAIASAIFDATDDADRVRSKRIARTEIGRALNAGHHLQTTELQGQGFQVVKTWVTVGDADVRASHVDMEGQQVEGADGQFNVGGYLVPYPRHFALPPGETVNCRCSFFTDIKGETEGQTP